MQAPEVRLSRLRENNLSITLAWAHIPKIWEYLPTSRKGEALTWEEHHNWWRNRTEDRQDWMILLKWGDFRYRPVGVIHMTGLKSEAPEVGLYIGEVGLWGMGIGREALRLLLVGFKDSKPRIRAVIHPHNKRSTALFASLGFVKVGKAPSERKNQDLYEVNFSSSL